MTDGILDCGTKAAMAPDLCRAPAGRRPGRGAQRGEGVVAPMDAAGITTEAEGRGPGDSAALDADPKLLYRKRRRDTERGVYTTANSTRGSKQPRRCSWMPRTEVLEENELQAMLARCNTKTPSGVRNRALLLLMARCGLRLGEAIAYAPQWLTCDTLPEGQRCWRLRIPTSVRKRRQEIDPIPVAPDAKAALDAWATMRKREGISGGAWFCTISSGRRGGFDGQRDLKPGRSLNPRYVRDLVQRLAYQADIRRRIHPHVLRHTCGHHVYQRTGDIELVRRILGHASLSSTTRYMHVGDTALAVAVGAIGEPEEPTDQATEIRELRREIAELRAKING